MPEKRRKSKERAFFRPFSWHKKTQEPIQTAAQDPVEVIGSDSNPVHAENPNDATQSGPQKPEGSEDASAGHELRFGLVDEQIGRAVTKSGVEIVFKRLPKN